MEEADETEMEGVDEGEMEGVDERHKIKGEETKNWCNPRTETEERREGWDWAKDEVNLQN